MSRLIQFISLISALSILYSIIYFSTPSCRQNVTRLVLKSLNRTILGVSHHTEEKKADLSKGCGALKEKIKELETEIKILRSGSTKKIKKLENEIKNLRSRSTNTAIAGLIPRHTPSSSVLPQVCNLYPDFWKNKTLEKQFKNLMVYVDKTFRDNNIEYCIAFGTALGFRRHGQLIPWDDDVDILVPSGLSERARSLVKPPFCTHNFWGGYKLFRCDSPNAGRYKWKYPFVDIFNDEKIYKAKGWAASKKSINHTILFPSVDIVMDGMTLKGPKNVDKHLVVRYGKSFNEKCVSPHWDHKNEKGKKVQTHKCKDIMDKCFSKIVHSSDNYESNTECRPIEINGKSVLYRSNLNAWNRKVFLHPSKISNFQTRKHWKPKCDRKCPSYKCELERRRISNIIKPLIQEWINLTDTGGELNIITFNWAGSSIASTYRNESIMHWDTDVDFMIWAHDTEKIEDFMDKYNQRENNQFKLIIQPDWRCKYNKNDKGNRRYYNSFGSSMSTRPKNGIKFVAPNVRLVDRKTHFHVDVWAMYAGEHSATQGKKFEKTTPTVNFLNYQYEQFQRPIEDIFPLKTCYLEGIRSWCPANAQNILNEEYGSTVSKPNHVLDEDTGCWVKPVK